MRRGDALVRQGVGDRTERSPGLALAHDPLDDLAREPARPIEPNPSARCTASASCVRWLMIRRPYWLDLEANCRPRVRCHSFVDPWAQMAANVVLPTAGNTAVGYWTLSSIGWKLERFVERTAVMIIAPTAPNVLLIILFGLGMGLRLFRGPNDWWLTFLPAAIGIIVIVVAVWAARWGHRLAERTDRRWLREELRVLTTGVTGTVEVLRQRNWRVLGTWVEILGAIAALWAALIAVGEHLPFAVVAMGCLIGQLAQVIPVPGGIGAIDAGVTGALVLYGADFDQATAGELIAHATHSSSHSSPAPSRSRCFPGRSAGRASTQESAAREPQRPNRRIERNIPLTPKFAFALRDFRTRVAYFRGIRTI